MLGPIEKSLLLFSKLASSQGGLRLQILTVIIVIFIYLSFGGKIMLWLELEHFMNCKVTTIHVEIFTVVITCKKSRFWNKNCKTLLAWSFMKCLGHGKKIQCNLSFLDILSDTEQVEEFFFWIIVQGIFVMYIPFLTTVFQY